MSNERRTYRVTADSWIVLKDILIGIPEEFNTNSANVRGRCVNTKSDTWADHLPVEMSIIFRNQIRNGQISYVIYSYNTPIAYLYTNNGYSQWVVPDIRYSVTTSKHQAKVSTAISQITV